MDIHIHIVIFMYAYIHKCAHICIYAYSQTYLEIMVSQRHFQFHSLPSGLVLIFLYFRCVYRSFHSVNLTLINISTFTHLLYRIMLLKLFQNVEP